MSFPAFKAKHGPGVRYAQAAAPTIDAYRGELPEVLLDDWRDEGFCSYADGLLYFLEPSQLAEVLADWLPPGDRSLVVARTAFADLVLWGESGVSYLDVHHHARFPLGDSLEAFIEASLCEDSYLEEIVRSTLYEEAVTTLGRPGPDECYAFVPALALGGPGTVDTLRRVRMDVHLAILAQLG